MGPRSSTTSSFAPRALLLSLIYMALILTPSYAFTTKSSTPLHPSKSSVKTTQPFLPTNNQIASSSTTALKENFDEERFGSVEKKAAYFDKVNGTGPGKTLLLIVLLINVWGFSIPPEFRRAQFCSAQQVIDYPDSHCTTFENWVGGIADYYKNGGGVHFDFSIEDKSKK